MDYKISGDSIIDIADAIREKTESSEPMLLSEMPDAIRAIETGGKEEVISMEDYLALTEEEKMNGKSYYIYDAQNEGREIQPVIYSDDEREIGVWRDGKPLYQKTFISNYVTPSHTSGAKNVNITIDVHDCNIETLVKAFGIWERWAGDDTKLLIQYGSYEGDGYERSRIRIDSENGYTNGRMNLYMYTDGTDWQQVTLQYTKTTDVAGSGVWTTSGIPAVHYDGNEKIIGTWFGETLYERTFDCGQMGYNTTVDYNHDITDISRIVEFNGLIYDRSNLKSINPLPIINGGSDYIRCGANETKIWFKCQDSWSSYNAIVTLRYTKTS